MQKLPKRILLKYIKILDNKSICGTGCVEAIFDNIIAAFRQLLPDIGEAADSDLYDRAILHQNLQPLNLIESSLLT
jgi:hypothetical protein